MTFVSYLASTSALVLGLESREVGGVLDTNYSVSLSLVADENLQPRKGSHVQFGERHGAGFAVSRLN